MTTVGRGLTLIRQEMTAFCNHTSPFREMGETRGVLRRFGGDPQRFRATMIELRRRLYAA